MIEKELSERINNEVDKLFDDQIRFTQKLTRFPSLRGQEHTAQDFLFDELTKRNYALDRWTVNVEDIKDHPGFSPVKVDYSNAEKISDPIGKISFPTFFSVFKKSLNCRM